MKNVYIDILVTVNFFIDYFLLLCTKKFLGIHIKHYRIIIGSFAGGLTSLSALLPPLPLGLNIFLDLLTAMLIIIITFGRCDIKTYIKRVLVYFTVSFIFCGIMIFIYLNFKPSDMGIFNDVVYFDISPVVLIILTLLCYYIMLLIKKFTGNILHNCICNVEIEIENRTFTFSAKIDSGCNVKEPFSGASVIIAERNLLDDFKPCENKCRIIPFETLSGEGYIKGFATDKVIIDGKVSIYPIYLGICENVFKGDTKALVPFDIISN
ncbi:MAG: sigma-E processing peptidase SpoIIGA [Ruminococcus sp.]|nr:sigma-E processing peptidase SpoIIGA [Ruminococcus sp.]